MAEKVAVYGSLRVGEGNYNHFFTEEEHLGTGKINGFKLYSLGCYPGIRPSGNSEDKVVVDLFDIKNEDTLQSVHRMEQGAGYTIERVPVKMDSGEEIDAIVYVYDSDLPEDRLVENGDWCSTRDNRTSFW